MQKIALSYMIVINAFTFFYFGLDKIKSQIHGQSRIAEKTLFLLIACGGSIGALIAMNVFRHKTQKTSFHLILALIIAIQIILVLLFIQ